MLLAIKLPCSISQIVINEFEKNIYYSTIMKNTFTGVFEKVEDWYVGYVQELIGANVQDKTLEEARESLREAIELILISNRELAEQELSGKDVIREEIKVNI